MGQDLTKVVTRWKLNQAHKSLLYSCRKNVQRVARCAGKALRRYL
jgi:hypothetical protein